jgi:hypothetical protein
MVKIINIIEIIVVGGEKRDFDTIISCVIENLSDMGMKIWLK